MEENKNTCPEDIKEQEAAEAEADKVELEQEATEEETEEKLSGKEKRKIKKAEAEIEKLNATIAEEQDKYLRLYAEYDNFRKRSAREREGVYTDAYCDALSQILPVLDNLERAAQFSTEDADSPMAKGVIKLRGQLASAMLKQYNQQKFDKSMLCAYVSAAL